jgi:uncharacterized protein (DUF2141 family)
MKRLIFLVPVLITAALLGCSTGAASLYTLSGTIDFTQENPGGKTVYVKLVNQGDGPTASALYSTTAVFSGNTATYAITDIQAGSYTVHSFIDMNDNGGSTQTPDAGDYVIDTNVTISGDQTLNPPDGGWTEI